MFDQFYHTRCRADDSVIGEEGFTVRAASVSANEIDTRRLHQLLVPLAAYELPISLLPQARETEGLSIGKAPVRLARVQIAATQHALVHSVYRADAGERRNSYFSHIALPRSEGFSISALMVLSLWGIQAEYGSPRGLVWRDNPVGDRDQAKRLPTWEPLAINSSPLVCEKSLRCFLEGKQVDVPAGYPILDVTPTRLQGTQYDPHRPVLLRFMIAQFLRGRRTYLIAEPGLAALLTWSLARLLPPPLTNTLTFSTYESLRTLPLCKLDVVNTIYEARDSFEASIYKVAENGTLLNTYQPPPWDLGSEKDSADDYGAYAVELMQSRKTSQLEAIWQTAAEVLASTSYSRNDFCEFWKHHTRLSRVDCEALADADVQFYVKNPVWQQVLFRDPKGRQHAVELATRQLGAIPSWWPVDRTDMTRLKHFQRWLPDFRERLLTRIQANLEQGNEQAGIASFCMQKLLPGLADDRTSVKSMLLELMNRFETANAASKLSNRLTWPARRLLLQAFKSVGVKALKELWLQPRTFSELRGLCSAELGLPHDWHGVALGLWLGDDASSSLETVSFLLERPDLLPPALERLAERSTGEEVNWTHKLQALFRALPTTEDHIQLCVALAKLDRPVLRDGLAQIIAKDIFKLAQAKTPWWLLLDDSAAMHGLSRLIASDSDAWRAMCEACIERLKGDSFFSSTEQNRVLRAMIRLEKDGRLPRLSNDDQQQKAAHLLRAYHALFETPPHGNDWLALRWSLKELQFERCVQEVLASLTATLVTSSSGLNHWAGEIIQTARTLLPPRSSETTVAWSVVLATSNLPTRQAAQIREALLQELAGMDPPAISGLLASMRSNRVAQIPEDIDDWLYERARTAASELRKSRKISNALSPWAWTMSAPLVLMTFWLCTALLATPIWSGQSASNKLIAALIIPFVSILVFMAYQSLLLARSMDDFRRQARMPRANFQISLPSIIAAALIIPFIIVLAILGNRSSNLKFSGQPAIPSNQKEPSTSEPPAPETVRTTEPKNSLREK